MYHVMRSTSELINVWMIFTLKMFGCLELQAFKHETAGVTMPRSMYIITVYLTHIS